MSAWQLGEDILDSEIREGVLPKGEKGIPTAFRADPRQERWIAEFIESGHDPRFRTKSDFYRYCIKQMIFDFSSSEIATSNLREQASALQAEDDLNRIILIREAKERFFTQLQSEARNAFGDSIKIAQIKTIAMKRIQSIDNDPIYVSQIMTLINTLVLPMSVPPTQDEYESGKITALGSRIKTPSN